MSLSGWTTTYIAGGLGLLAGGLAPLFTAAPQSKNACVVYTPVPVERVEAPWRPSERLSGVTGWPEMTRLVVPYEPEAETPVQVKDEAGTFLKPEAKESLKKAKERRARHHRVRHSRSHRRHW